MNNKVIGLIFRAFSQILHNQEKIMRHYGEENFYLLEDTNELSVKYGELAQEYFKKEVIDTRDPEKLDSVYTQLCEIHKKSFPDMRPGQFLLNALGYINSTLHRDPFFPESDELIELFKQYANSNSMWYQGWDVLNRKENDND